MRIVAYGRRFARNVEAGVEKILDMDIKEIKQEFGDCDWMRVVLDEWTIEAIQWLIDRVETLETHKMHMIEKERDRNWRYK